MSDENYGFIYKPSDKEVPDYCHEAWTVNMNAGLKNFEKEYGLIKNIGILGLDQVKLLDSKGNEILCKCGNKPSTTITGKDSFISICSDCLTPYCL